MVEAHKQFCLEREITTLLRLRVNNLFECKDVLFRAPIPDPIHSAKAPSTQKSFNNITFTLAILYDGSIGERCLFLQHTVPRK